MSTPGDHAPNRGGSRNGPSRKRANPFGSRNRNRRGPPGAGLDAVANQQNHPFSSSSASPSAATATAPAPAPAAGGSSEGLGFDDLARHGVDPKILTALRGLNLTTMTAVQAQTLPLTLAGGDMLAQAKTGTGKTIAFLLPAVQKLAATSAANAASRGVSALVISPTRELAFQIAADAKRLLTGFPRCTVHTAVGGTNPNTGLKAILGGCDILVATPGRMLDYLGQPGMELSARLRNVQTFVLDEADRLLDMGFLPDIKKIVEYLPDKASTGRQGMLFSATINSRVQQFASIALSPGYKFISTIPKGEAQTHEHVPQRLVVVPTPSDLATAMVGALRHEVAAASNGAFKAIVFAPTAAQVEFYSHVLGSFDDLPRVTEIHSRLSQAKRTTSTNQFRNAESGILVATDVIARGMDFPGVTNVFQVGLPAETESYIHRLGRTARAGAEGRGTLLVTSAEAAFPKKNLSMIKFVDAPADLSAHPQVMTIVRDMDPEKQAKVYRAWLGFHKSHLKILGWDAAELVRQGNTLALKGLGASEIPSIEKKTVGKMGLKGVPGLNIAPSATRR